MDRYKLKVIGFDADDTLWENETYFAETEAHFCSLMSSYASPHETSAALLKQEESNLELYGYGIKGHILSMIETALELSCGKLPNEIVGKILELGKRQIERPLELFQGVEEALTALKKLDLRLILVTKGDLLDQERKLASSGIGDYFHHIEIMSDKKRANYEKLITHLDIEAQEFLMVGNSLKSDVIPVLEMGGAAVHIPFHTTWHHEVVDEIPLSENFRKIDKLQDLTDLLGTW